jgi:hypothetical protein
VSLVKEVAHVGNELDHYRSARDVLGVVLSQLDGVDLMYAESSPVRPEYELETVVGMLCQQARAAQHLTSAAEALCAALVAGQHRHTG